MGLRSERVDDIPLLVGELERMGVPRLLDEQYGRHGNWQGLSLGWVATVWLGHILSQADHRLNQVQSWAEQRLVTLRICTGQVVRALDLSDDRLAAVVKALSDGERWTAFEDALTGHLVRVYRLRVEQVRLDSTTASGHHGVTEDGLFQFGHSKDHRPDLPQVKVMLSTLDPLGMPVATEVLAGDRADDPLYRPAIARVRASLGQRGLLYVGDAKMAALETRAEVHAGGDHYLCPLTAIQVPAGQLDALLAPVWAEQQQLEAITRAQPNGEPLVVAEGFEQAVPQRAPLPPTPTGPTGIARADGDQAEPMTWIERRLVVRSLQRAAAGAAALDARLQKAQAAILALNERRRGKPRPRDVPSLLQTVEAIVARYTVAGLLQVTAHEQVQARPLRRYRGRPAGQAIDRALSVSVAMDEAAVAQAKRRLGWRVYATNAPATVGLEQAVLAYRDAHLIEGGFGRLKGQPLSLTPLFLQRDDHVTGLLRLLSIGLRLLTLVQHVVRQQLAAQARTLAGLSPGNPARSTARPTTEALLAAFRYLTLTIVTSADTRLLHLSPLSPLQTQILALLGCPPDLYSRLAAPSRQPPPKMSER
jgi:transposase